MFNTKDGFRDLPTQVACGRCIGCKLEYSRGWAVRIMHETQFHESNAFLTLTLNDEHVPANASLELETMQKFLKRYRRSIEPQKISMFYSGEYGDENRRPHYHAIIFGHDFPDKTHWKETDYGYLWKSAELEKLWGKGYCSIGSVTFESAAYVARYTVKKITGDPADRHYQHIDADGVIHQIVPEFAHMSRRPAIGKRWFNKFKTDLYPADTVVVRGHEQKIPRYYDKLFEAVDPRSLQKIKWARTGAANTRRAKHENSPGRLAVREQVKKAQIRSLKRRVGS